MIVDQDIDGLTTRLTCNKLVHFVLPKEMNKKDFQILDQWICQLRKATFYEAETDDTKSNSVDELQEKA